MMIVTSATNTGLWPFRSRTQWIGIRRVNCPCLRIGFCNDNDGVDDGDDSDDGGNDDDDGDGDDNAENLRLVLILFLLLHCESALGAPRGAEHIAVIIIVIIVAIIIMLIIIIMIILNMMMRHLGPWLTAEPPLLASEALK